MTQINDAIVAVVGDDINGGLLVYYNTNNGAPDFDGLQDAEEAFLIEQGENPANLNDMWDNFLSTAPQSLTGALNDMKLAWWTAGAPLV